MDLLLPSIPQHTIYSLHAESLTSQIFLLTELKAESMMFSNLVLIPRCKSRVILFLWLLGIVALLHGSAVEARIRRYKWEVKYEYKSPDCLKKLVITINGRTPGPTITAQQNDTIIVELTNSLFTENVAIHWHGIRQIGTPWFDGTEGVSQCPILPGTTFKYQFVVDRVSLCFKFQGCFFFFF